MPKNKKRQMDDVNLRFPLFCNFVSTVATGIRRYSRKIFPKNASPSKTGVCSTKNVVNAWYTFIYTIFTLVRFRTTCFLVMASRLSFAMQDGNTENIFEEENTTSLPVLGSRSCASGMSFRTRSELNGNSRDANSFGRVRCQKLDVYLGN
jgi:hypothetical protein